MKTLTAQLPDETFAEAEALAATANLSRDEYVARALRAFAVRQRRRAEEDVESIAAYDAMADAPEMQLSDERRARRNARWKELGEW